MSSTRPVLVQIVKGLHKETFFVPNKIFAGTHCYFFADSRHMYSYKLTLAHQ